MFFFFKTTCFQGKYSQFVNHTVTLVENKNNNERISLKMRVMRLVFEKNVFFSNNVYSGKKIFFKICFFSSVFFLHFFLNVFILLLKVV